MAKKKQNIEPLLLSTGSTLLNIEMTGNSKGGWYTGHYYLFVGDSDSGKSWFMHTTLAEAANNPAFDNYRLIYDYPEAKSSLIDVERYFGKKLAQRIEQPMVRDGQPASSETAEEFYYNVHDATKQDRPFVYILDSQDSLTCNREANKFQKLKAKSRGSNVDVASGDYADGKAKVHSSHLRQLIMPLARTNSLLIIVNQSRDSFDMFERDSYSGGRALKFYAVAQLWSYHAGKLEKTFRKKKRQTGIKSRIKIKKNHVTGRQGETTVPIYHSHGIDDVGSCVDYLIGENIWDMTKQGVVRVVGLGPDWEASREKVVQRIEHEGLEDDLQDLVGEVWQEIQDAVSVKRKQRYE